MSGYVVLQKYIYLPKLSVNVTMTRRGSDSLVLLLRQCPTKLISKRQISFLKIARSYEQRPLTMTMPWFTCGPGKQFGIRRVKMLTVVKRFVASEADAGRKMILENVPELKKKQRKNTVVNTMGKCGTMDNFQNVKNIIGASVLKEDNLDMFWKLSQGNPEIFNDLRTWQMKIDILSKILGATPKIDEEKWLSFLRNTQSTNEHLLSYLMTTAIKRQKDKKRKISFPVIDDEDVDENDGVYDDPMCYHLFHNSLFLNIRIKAMRRLLYSKAMTSILYGPELFIDCSYDNFMKPMEAKYLSKQIIEGVNKNLRSFDPFHIILCNFNKNSEVGKCMLKYSSLFYDENYPVTVTSKSYLDFVPKEKLVYLTPHCSRVMNELDPNKRYIIGGFVDKSCPDQVSLAKAKENKIEMLKFPIDKYLDWQQGKKTLCVNHVMFILLSLKNSNNDWLKAFEVLPKRNFVKKAPGSAKLKKVSKVLKISRMVNRLRSSTNFDKFMTSETM